MKFVAHYLPTYIPALDGPEPEFYSQPVQQPHPPLWVAASRSDDTYRWAGEKGFNLLTLPYMY